MGMYVSDDAHDSVRGMQLTGLLTSTAREWGFEIEHGFLSLSRAEVAVVLSDMVRSLEKGRTLVDESGVVGAQSLRSLVNDAKAADSLISWLVLSDDAELTFA